MTRSKSLFVTIITLIGIVTQYILGGLGTFTGREQGAWTEDRNSVVIAKIEDIEELDAKLDHGTHHATIHPIATIAGTLDPSLYSTLDVRFYVSDMTSSIKRSKPLPKNGDLVLVVISLAAPPTKDETSPKNGFIISDICTFMPNDSSLVELKGFDDSRVMETLERLRKVRQVQQ